MGRRRKKDSKIIETAKARLAGLIAIDPALDLGSGKNIPTYETKITETESSLAIYNQKLAELDELYNDFLAKEKDLGTFNAEILAAVKGLYGRDSDEYEQAGGTRYSERKKPQKSDA